MRNFQEKSKWQKFFESKPALVFFSLFIIFFAWNVLGFWGKMENTYKNKQLAEKKVEELRIDKEKLSTDIAKLETDTGIEETIRNKFGLSKEGEEVIMIVEDEKEQEARIEDDVSGVFSFFRNLFK